MEREKLVRTVTAAQKGDGEALNTLFNEFYNDVYYFAMKTVKDSDLACDITQETFVEIINTLDQLQEPAAFVTWMKQITYHQCTRYFKKKKDVLVDEDEEGNTIFDTLTEEKTEFIPDEALDQQDFRKTILDMIDQLSEEQRAAIMMYYFDELSVKQIAEIQGCSEGTVKSRLNYARKSIKASVEDYEKKNGVKLHCVGVLPLLLWLWNASRETMSASAAGTVAQGVAAATGTAVTVSAGTATATAVGTTIAANAASSGAGLLAKISLLPPVVRAAAGITAAAVLLGGIGVGIGVGVGIASQQKDPVPSIGSGPATSVGGTQDTTPTTSETIPSDIPASSLPQNTSDPTNPSFPTEQTDPSIPATEGTETEPDLPVIEPVIPGTDVTVPETDPTIPETESTVPGTEVTAPETEATTLETTPQLHGDIISEGCTYTMADGTILSAGEYMPAVTAEGDVFATEEYSYTYYAADAGWRVAAIRQDQTAYGTLLSSVNSVPVTSLNNAFNGCSKMISAPAIPGSITDLSYAYQNCSALMETPIIPNGVTNLDHVFYGCSDIQDAPILPESVTNVEFAFYGCTNLKEAPALPRNITSVRATFYNCALITTAPVIPQGVTNMLCAFFGCAALKEPPVIPDGVTNMEGTFYKCSSLAYAPAMPDGVTTLEACYAYTTFKEPPVLPASVTNLMMTFQYAAITHAPEIPYGVTDMSATFCACKSLLTAPLIPDTVISMPEAFYYCNVLTAAPEIPASVTNMYRTFESCHKLKGTIVIHANPTEYSQCFKNTNYSIILTGSSSLLNELAATASYGNVSVQS